MCFGTVTDISGVVGKNGVDCVQVARQSLAAAGAGNNSGKFLSAPKGKGVIIVGLVGADFGPDEARLVKLPGHHLGRLAVALVHPEKEEGEHDRDHGERRKAQVARRPDKKVDRHTDECAGPEADHLPFGQAEQDFGFDPRQVTRDGNISRGGGAYVPFILTARWLG